MHARRIVMSSLISAGLLAFVLWGPSRIGASSSSASSEGRRAPEFPSLAVSSWSGMPTSLASLRGRVVVLNVWTLGCVNCRRTLPWVASVHERFASKGVAVIGVHSPEFDYEKDLEAIGKARKEHGLDYPSFVDNRLEYWQALDNHYWPALYLIDKRGTIRRVQIGEVHAGDESAMSLESEITRLLAEPAMPVAQP